jgi:LAO/AO transport system kinase
MRRTPDQLLSEFQQHDRRALAEILTYVDAGEPVPLAPSPSKQAVVVGITGSGGAGKSTLVAAMIDFLRSQGQSVAVLACDPQSPVTGGALLGDRIRMRLDPADDQIFVRSLSTRGGAGGISNAVGPAIDWLKAFGFDVIIVETVGGAGSGRRAAGCRYAGALGHTAHRG